MLRTFFVVLSLTIFSFTLGGCQPPPEPEKPKGVLRIATIPADMPIIVNGELKGNSPAGEGQYFSISLEEGEHLVEVLKPIDEEKEQYAEKTVFIAANTVPIVTFKAEERLTSFGKQEKARREAEAVENARLAEIERKKAAAISAEKNKQERIKALKLAKAQKEKALKEIEANMLQIPAGNFLMGSGEDRSFGDNLPRRLVTMKTFKISKYEVTRDQFSVFATDTNFSAKGCGYSVPVKKFLKTSEGRKSSQADWKNPPQIKQRGNHPVVCINISAMESFIRWLNKETGKQYRLPSEAEWEYASLAGADSTYHWGEERPKLQMNGFGDKDGYEHTSPVGKFPPNAWGVYDTVGNVSEVLEDCYVYSYETAHQDNTPLKTEDCKNRRIRGGNWKTDVFSHYSLRERQNIHPEKKDYRIGFRLASDN